MMGRVRNDRGKAVPSATDVFKNMSDLDFFTDQVQHLYFYGVVDDCSVSKLQDDLRAANQSTVANDIVLAPKPIVIHVNSPGGSVASAMSMLTVFTRSHTPICVMVDGTSASAATMLSVIAPYRVGATSHVMTLIHQYSAWLGGSREQIEFDNSLNNQIFDETFRQLYLTNTRMTAPQLDEMLSRDMLLDTAFCVKHGIMDRVLSVDNIEWIAGYRHKRGDSVSLPMPLLMTKTNWNTFTVACASGNAADERGNVEKLDQYLCQQSDSLKPVLYYCTPRCRLDGTQWIPIVARLRAFRVPVFAVTDAAINVWDYLPALYCIRKYMYSHAIVVIDLVYSHHWGRRLPDIVHNTTLITDTLRNVLRERTRLPEAVLGALTSKRFKFSAQECLAYGLCDEIVPLGGPRPK